MAFIIVWKLRKEWTAKKYFLCIFSSKSFKMLHLFQTYKQPPQWTYRINLKVFWRSSRNVNIRPRSLTFSWRLCRFSLLGFYRGSFLGLFLHCFFRVLGFGFCMLWQFFSKLSQNRFFVNKSASLQRELGILTSRFWDLVSSSFPRNDLLPPSALKVLKRRENFFFTCRVKLTILKAKINFPIFQFSFDQMKIRVDGKKYTYGQNGSLRGESAGSLAEPWKCAKTSFMIGSILFFLMPTRKSTRSVLWTFNFGTNIHAFIRHSCRDLTYLHFLWLLLS